MVVADTEGGCPTIAWSVGGKGESMAELGDERSSSISWDEERRVAPGNHLTILHPNNPLLVAVHCRLPV
jgi:hypothetical protein